MKIQLTGAKVEKIGTKFYVFYCEQIVACLKDYTDAMVLAMDESKLRKLLRESNTH